jgi:hypothetical protein
VNGDSLVGQNGLLSDESSAAAIFSSPPGPRWLTSSGQAGMSVEYYFARLAGQDPPGMGRYSAISSPPPPGDRDHV